MTKPLLATMLLTSAMYLNITPGTASAQGKSRDQVKQELVQAQHDGVVPAPKTQYPGTEQTIARNKDTHAATTHAGESTPPVDNHDKR